MTEFDPQSPEFQAREIRKFARVLGIAAAILAALPALIGWLATPSGRQYLPFHMSLDDHMVYAAWMRQAMDGHILFDNRFTTAAQPGLTFHAFFLLLGWIAKGIGIPATLALARISLSYLVVRQIGELLVRLNFKSFAGKYALVIACFGGGVSFLFWQTYGDAYSPPGNWFTTLMMGRQPIDNWQPEAFVFPSMLTNALFLASACLIIWTLNSVLDCRKSWKPVIPGAIAFGLLMNIHSYDVLLVALVLVAFAATMLVTKSLSGQWALRTLVIGLGAVPAALWFVYVLRHDPVFQSRAATPTFTGSFRQIAIGILPLVLLACIAVVRSDIAARRRYLGLAGLAVL
ncbi:MAG TPA: hypothetical protein VNI20_06560, partial [Fimbriimonadaceae bacterium]|nr:hypothetical protein [Fimbriimonadaceae bacterium]